MRSRLYTFFAFNDSSPDNLVKAEWADRVALPVEDYLHGVISLVNDLVRTSVGQLQMMALMTSASHGWL